MIVAIVVVGLVSYRIWRLLAVDEITERPREWLLNRNVTAETDARLHRFLSCPWCSGFWITGLVTFGWWLIEGSTNPVAIWLASSVVVGFLGERS